MGADYTGLARLGDIAQHIILPGMTLALYFLASYARLTRTAMIEVADQDFVKTARAKGISERQVARRHILRNALIPLITYAGLQASILVGGSVLVENVFSWPGIGTLAYRSGDRRATIPCCWASSLSPPSWSACSTWSPTLPIPSPIPRVELG